MVSLNGTRRDEWMETRKRTKEELIAAQREARAIPEHVARAADVVASDLASGEGSYATRWLADLAGSQWARRGLRDFDLRRVDEQGRFIDGGWLALPSAPNARKCLALTAPSVQCQEPATHKGHDVEGQRCFAHAPEHYAPMMGACLTWEAGEHLDDVLRAGAERVTGRARAALEKPGRALAEEAGGAALRGLPRALVFDEITQFTAEDADAVRRRINSEGGKALRALVEGARATALDERGVLDEVRKAMGLPRAELPDVASLTMEMVDAASKRLGVTAQALLDKLHDMVDRTLREQGAAPPVDTFADLLAARRPARVFVLEPDGPRRKDLRARLCQLGFHEYVASGRFIRNPLEVRVTSDRRSFEGMTCDVAVGFSQVDAAVLALSARPQIVPSEAAPHFWGMA